ncbi:MAG: Uma2 family endonuclease [Acidovorax sp.]|uniref:Uma2 family endonuclease n=1 Tax=Acidovorax sp. TaxID=1872122 RepID=UPI0039E5CE37
MSRPALKDRFDAEAYLAWEAEQTEKHEYANGEVFAMSGALENHVTVALNVAIALRSHLRGGPCSVFISDMKLHVQADDAFYYPDVFVTCAESDRAESRHKSTPSLVVEVLSSSTAAYDRGAKFASYRKLPSLREYVLIDPERLSVDLFRRGDDGHWVLHPFVAGERVEFSSVGLALPIEDLYEDVRFDPEAASTHP